VLVLAAAIVVIAGVGIANTEIGLDLEDFYPSDSQGGMYTKYRQMYFPNWPMTVNWGPVDYHTADVQMYMVKQFEAVGDTSHAVAASALSVWTASFATWGINETITQATGAYLYSSGHPCSASNPATSGVCGADYPSDGCIASWVPNKYNLRLVSSSTTGYCYDMATVIGGPYSTGEYCPVMVFSTQAEMATCLAHWANTRMDATASPGYNQETDLLTPQTPIKYSYSTGGLNLYGDGLTDANEYVKLIERTRAVCDDDETLHCWMSGIAFDYWEQYLTIKEWLGTIAASAVAVGFGVSFLFLLIEALTADAQTKPPLPQIIFSSFMGALMIMFTCAFSVYCVVGFCGLAEVKLCGFSAMSYLMAIGFAVEYSVHITHRYLIAPYKEARDRLDYAMSFLFKPTLMAFAASFVGILVMSGAEMKFLLLYFFTPLLVVIFMSYFWGTFVLPMMLPYVMNGNGVRLVLVTEDKLSYNKPGGGEAESKDGAPVHFTSTQPAEP